MSDYLLFFAISAVTILSPGPGVVNTLSSSIRFGFRGALPGIVGLTAGSLAIAVLAATGLGLLLVNSSFAFSIVKIVGALYLCGLGIKLWMSTSSIRIESNATDYAPRSLFWQGTLIQVLNPKAVLFFVSIFPQFIDYSDHIVARFSLLIATYCFLIVVIHATYALLAHSIRRSLATPAGERITRRTAGTSYLVFGAGLAATSR